MNVILTNLAGDTFQAEIQREKPPRVIQYDGALWTAEPDAPTRFKQVAIADQYAMRPREVIAGTSGKAGGMGASS